MARQHKTSNFSNRVGLDIGTHSIKGVEISERGPEVVVRSAGSIVLPSDTCKSDSRDPASVIQAIRNLWSKYRFKSQNVVLALPPDAVYMKWLHFDASDEDELDHLARTTAARGAPFPLDDAVIDYRILSSQAARSHIVYSVLLVAAFSPKIDELLNIAEQAGLCPLSVDVGTAACVRSIGMNHKTRGLLWGGQPIAHCVIGSRYTTIAVMRGDSLEFARTISVGGDDFTESIAESLGIDRLDAERMKCSPNTRLTGVGILNMTRDGQQVQVSCEQVVGRLARELLRSLRYFSSQFADGSYLGMIGSASLSGGGSLLGGIDACIQQQAVEISGIINPFAGYSVDAEGSGVQHLGNSMTAYTTALGLAIGRYWSANSKDDNFRIAA